MRRRHLAAEWEPTPTGWRFGRYGIANRGPQHWVLEFDGKVRSTHRRASDAAAQAQRDSRARRRWLVIVRNLAAITIGAVVVIAAQAWRFIPNDVYTPARDAALTLESAYRSVATGDRPVASYAGAEGITGGAFTTQLPIDLGESITAPVRSYEALVAMHDGECYVVRWTPDVTPRRYSVLTGVLKPGLACDVHPRLVQSGLYRRVASQAVDAPAFDWEGVLPPTRHQAVWFVPVVIGAAFVILQGLIGISLAFVRPPRHGVPTLTVVPSTNRHRSPSGRRDGA